jgi:hypothetical protein
MNFSYFSKNTAQRASAIVNLNDLATLIRNGANGLSETIKQARAVYNPENKSEYDGIKKHLPAFVPHRFDGTGRKLENLTSYSGRFIGDIDGLTASEAIQVRDYFAQSEYVEMAFLSPSGRGVKVLIKTNTTDKSQARAVFEAVTGYFEPILSKALGRKITFDGSGKDATRLCYLSYDPDLYFNAGAETFAVRTTDSAPQPTKAERTHQKGQREYDYEFIKSTVTKHLDTRDFSPFDGGRHGVLLSLAGLLNSGGVNYLVAETIFRDVLSAYGCEAGWIESKIKNPLHSTYVTYSDTFGTRPLCAGSTIITTAILNGTHIGTCADTYGMLLQWIRDTVKGLIKAVTGTGKTTAILSIAFELLAELRADECIYFVTPCTISAEQAHTDFIKRCPQAESDTLLAIGKKEDGESWLNAFDPLEKAGIARGKRPKIFIGTPDQLSRLHELNDKARKHGGDFYKVRYCFADEMHTAISHTSFRVKMFAVSQCFADPDCKFFAITGTPEHFSDQIFPTQFHVTGNVLPNFHITHVVNFDATLVLNNVLKALEKGRKVVICWDNKAKAKWLQGELSARGYSVELINSDTKDGDAYKELAYERKVSADVVIGTNLIQDAVSIENEEQFDLHYVYEKTFADKHGLNPNKVRQFAARCRRNGYVPLTVYAGHPKEIKPCKQNQLKAELAYAQIIAEGFTDLELGTNANLYAVCNTAKARFFRDGTVNLLSVWRIALEKYYRSRSLDDFKADLVRLFGVPLHDPTDDDFIPSETLTDDLKELRKEYHSNTEKVLTAIDSESVVNAMVNIFGEKGLKKIRTAQYGDGRRADAVQSANDLETIAKINKAELLNSQAESIVKRLIFLREKGFTHNEAVELVKEHISPNCLRVFKTQLTASLIALGEKSDNVVTAYDLNKDAKAVKAIRDYIKANGNEILLSELSEYMKKRPDIEHWHHSKDKLAILLTAYFKTEKVRINAGEKRNKRAWKVIGEMDLAYCLESNAIKDGDGRIEKAMRQGWDIIDTIYPKRGANEPQIITYEPVPNDSEIIIPVPLVFDTPTPRGTWQDAPFRFGDDLLDRLFTT